MLLECSGGRGILDMSIVENRKAFHDYYFIEERLEAGLALEGLGSEGDPCRTRAT